jgi:hypothetical protein
VPPIGRRLSSNRALEIAGALPKMRAVRARYGGSYGGAYLKGPGRWQVSYFSRQDKEIGQVILADRNGRVLEQWTGFQIAWSMARGYAGAFGRHVNALYIWIPLCLLFFLPFFDWRKPLRLLHLDLLALLSFSVSLAFFNHGRIYVSTPLVYPPLVYLLVRMLLLARVGRRTPGARERVAAGEPALGVPGPPSFVGPREPGPLRLPACPSGGAPEGVPARVLVPFRMLVPAPWLAVGVVFLIGFRVGLNVTDSNVIDVGYAGVIGAQRIAHDRALYGGYPTDNEHGDTYGPVNYEAYVPFQQIFGWSGHWDGLPAAHAAAIVFDLLAVALLFLLGRRVRGPALGVALAYAWVSYPFTLFTLESNSNDTLVAVLVLAALLACTPRWGVASFPPGARAHRLKGLVGHGHTTRKDGSRRGGSGWVGALAALGGLSKFAPLALAPLLCADGFAGMKRARRMRAVGLFAGAFLLTVAVASVPALAHDSLHTIFQRTFAYQSNRESPFSIWGLYRTPPTLAYAQATVQGAALALAVSVAILPRRLDFVGLGATAAAVLIAVQLGIDHWFYLYIPWFFGLVMLALLGQFSWSGSQARAAPSGSARSSQLAAA